MVQVIFPTGDPDGASIRYDGSAHGHDFAWTEHLGPPNHYRCRRCDYAWYGSITMPVCEADQAQQAQQAAQQVPPAQGDV